jgi:hypothetical protein
MRNITAEDIKNRALTDDEKGWLLQRDRHADVAKNEELFDGSEDDASESSDEFDDEYDSWKNRELLDEGAKRDPAVDFSAYDQNKAGYIAALRAWDQEHPEAE